MNRKEPFLHLIGKPITKEEEVTKMIFHSRMSSDMFRQMVSYSLFLLKPPLPL